MRIKRPYPRRPASWYPVGTELSLRDGRKFAVVAPQVEQWYDPTEGHGGGEWIIVTLKRRWKEL